MTMHERIPIKTLGSKDRGTSELTHDGDAYYLRYKYGGKVYRIATFDPNLEGALRAVREEKKLCALIEAADEIAIIGVIHEFTTALRQTLRDERDAPIRAFRESIRLSQRLPPTVADRAAKARHEIDIDSSR